MIEVFFTQPIYKLTTSRNDYGDIVYTNSGQTQVRGYIRENTEITRTNQAEDNNVDAIGWFRFDADLTENDILLFDSVFYRVSRIIKSKPFTRTRPVMFKCELERHRGIVS